MKQTNWIVCAMLAAVGGCSQGVSVDNGNPSGTVAGVVLDATSEAPLMGAAVTVIAGSKTLTAMTDMNGQFAVGKVPAGTFIMSVSQMGFVTAQLTDVLGGAVGNFPVNNPQRTIGPVGLFPATGTFTVHVVDETGAPVPSLKLSARTGVRQVVWQNGAPLGEGAYEVSATTGMDGSAMFNGLPVYAGLVGLVDDSFTVSVPPTKIMGTEIYDFLGASFGFHLNGLVSSAQVIHLAGPHTALTIVDSSIEYLRGYAGTTTQAFTAPVGSLIPINGPINIAFNQAIDPSSLRTEFLDGDGKLMATMAMATVNLNQVSVTPSVPLAAGKRFNLILHAVAATTAGTLGSGAQLDVTAPFFSQPPAGAPITVVANSVTTIQPPGGTGNVTVQFELSEPIGIGGGSNAALDCVAFYEIGSMGLPGFNNDGTTVFQGDWKTISASNAPPTNLVCRQTVAAGVAGEPEINVTALSSLETNTASTNPTVVTGFSSKFSITIAVAPTTGTGAHSGPCKQPLISPTCALPGSGTKVHLIFSRQDSSTTVKRVDGTTVPDNIIVQL
ncbi:MAG TPA: carboxypeptidase regulatory-like domain-containing protein [Polyangia bacterium]|nr:carboxypeptidase regulatory-like domain-containing protein [Polyangia bacterium]